MIDVPIIIFMPSHLIGQHISFVYPFGATLTVQKPAVAVLSSGSVSFPVNRPVCAFYSAPLASAATTKGASTASLLARATSDRGRVCVLASVHLMSDQYLSQQENTKLTDVLMRWLTESDASSMTTSGSGVGGSSDALHAKGDVGPIVLNAIDAEDPEVADYRDIPDTQTLAERLRVCLQVLIMMMITCVVLEYTKPFIIILLCPCS